MDFTQQLREALHGERATPLMEYKGRIYSRGEISDLAEVLLTLLDDAGVPDDAKIGIVVRNRVLHAAAILGLIANRRSLTSVYSMQSAEAMAAEAANSAFGALIADAEDWNEPLTRAVANTGGGGIVLSHGTPITTPPISLVPGLEKVGSGPFLKVDGEQGLEVLSSGTTGKPKRILFPFRMLVRAVESASAPQVGTSEPEILTWPYDGIGGMCILVSAVVLGRLTTILDKFNVPEWTEAVKRHRPSSVSGPPTVARMILDAKVPPEELRSIRYFFGGGAPMSPELQSELESTYGVKVIWAYGATEFCGTTVSWTPDLHKRYGVEKRGAMGRALPGVQLRVVDVESGEPLTFNKVGYLSALVPTVKDNWITTTDLALIDADGFVFHQGRDDGAIIRGGFKILPEKIAAALLTHPAVALPNEESNRCM